MRKIPSFDFKKFILYGAIGFFIYYLASRWVGLDTIVNILQKTDLLFLFLALIAELTAYLGTALLIKSIFKAIKKINLSLRTYYKLATITVVAIHSLPVSVFGEAAFNYYFLRKKKVPTGSILSMLVTRLIFAYTAFFVILGIALVSMPVLQDVSLSGKIASLLVFLALIIGIIFARNLYLNFQRFRKVVGRLVDLLDKAKKTFLKRERIDEKQKESVIKDIHYGLSPLDSPSLFIKQTAIATIYWLADMLSLFFVLYSLGFMVNPIKMVIAYGVAITLGAISFIPGGLGVIEGSLGIMLVNVGVPVDITIMGVIIYRLISFWIMIPIGFFSALSLNKK